MILNRSSFGSPFDRLAVLPGSVVGQREKDTVARKLERRFCGFA
jgi:hypothetical protein